MATLSKLNRRDFLIMTGVGTAGLALYAAIKSDFFNKNTPAALTAPTAQAAPLNVFVHIGTNDRVTITAHRSEMGQGIRTSLPQIVADELDADWDKVDIVQAQANEKYGDQNTDGSHSVRSFYQTMREMGASAKHMLCAAAAEQWQVPVTSCIAKGHSVTHAESGKSLRYGELAVAAAKQPIPDVKLLSFKTPADYKFIGKPIPMVDMDDMVRGTTHFGIDTKLPDMVYASIERCPVMSGKVKSFDASKALLIPGVIQTIKMDGGNEPTGFNPLAGVAVIATNTWAAMEGRKALEIIWETSPHATYDSRATIANLVSGAAVDPKTVRSHGDIESVFAKTTKVHEAVYSIPHMEHATMEPPAATVRITGDLCEIWACVQNPVGARDVVASAIGFKPEQVVVNVTLLGSAFGRKSKPDFVIEAAVLAKAIGKPVKVTWSREDATRNGYYHAYSVQHFKAALDESHRIIGMDSSVASPSIMSLFKPGGNYLQNWELEQGFSSVPYDIPNVRMRNFPAPVHTRIGWMRSVFNINHAFALNSFIDELARLNKIDSLEYQLAAIGSDREVKALEEGAEQKDYPFKTARLKNVLQAVQKSTGWPAPVNTFEGWGVATHRSFLSYVAVATKVRLEHNQLRILEVHIVLDCGQMVNPDRVHSQMEGAVIFGLSAALFGEITFKNGAIEQSSFDDYYLLRINQSPKIVVTLISSDEKHTGVGEPGVPPIAASVTNAIVAAGGPRIRELPIKNHVRIA